MAKTTRAVIEQLQSLARTTWDPDTCAGLLQLLTSLQAEFVEINMDPDPSTGPSMQIALAMQPNGRVAAITKCRGDASFGEMGNLLATAIHAALTMAESIDRNSIGDGSFVSYVTQRVEQLNQDPNSHVVEQTMEVRDKPKPP